jgi:hypothetical protein
LIDRQRRDQETMFRAFTNGMHIFCCFIYESKRLTLFFIEISGEIKGERLRFVEAMKEATAINVQSTF